MKTIKLLLLFVSLNFAFQATAQTEVYTTKTGKKYHRGYCRYLSKSKIKTTIQRAKNFGYTACKVCKPVEVTTKKKIDTVKSSNKVVIKNDTVNKKEIAATQCTAKTKAGVRCKRKTKHKSGKCHQHHEHKE